MKKGNFGHAGRPGKRGGSLPGSVSPIVQFWSMVNKDGPVHPVLGTQCWLWTGFIAPNGYGQFRRDGAHRWIYEHEVGPIPVGSEPDHLCRVRHCVNLKHLELVTSYENWRRGESSGAKAVRSGHCAKGHAFTPENTRERSDHKGGRRCRICEAARMRARRAKETMK